MAHELSTAVDKISFQIHIITRFFWRVQNRLEMVFTRVGQGDTDCLSIPLEGLYGVLLHYYETQTSRNYRF